MHAYMYVCLWVGGLTYIYILNIIKTVAFWLFAVTFLTHMTGKNPWNMSKKYPIFIHVRSCFSEQKSQSHLQWASFLYCCHLDAFVPTWAHTVFTIL